MATVVVGYVPKPEGEAALERAVQEAELRGLKLVVVSSQRGGPDYDEQSATEHDAALDEVRRKLDAKGVPYVVRQLVRGFDPADDPEAVRLQELLRSDADIPIEVMGLTPEDALHADAEAEVAVVRAQLA